MKRPQLFKPIIGKSTLLILTLYAQKNKMFAHNRREKSTIIKESYVLTLMKIDFFFKTK